MPVQEIGAKKTMSPGNEDSSPGSASNAEKAGGPGTAVPYPSSKLPTEGRTGPALAGFTPGNFLFTNLNFWL